METFCPPQTNLFWYNVRIPCKRDESIFDTDLETGMENENLFPGHRPEVSVGSRVPRDRVRDNGHTQQRIGFRGEAANFPQRKTGYGGASRGIHAACLLSCFSFRFLAAPTTKWDFEGAPLSFSAPKRRHPVG